MLSFWNLNVLVSALCSWCQRQDSDPSDKQGFPLPSSALSLITHCFLDVQFVLTLKRKHFLKTLASFMSVFDIFPSYSYCPFLAHWIPVSSSKCILDFTPSYLHSLRGLPPDSLDGSAPELYLPCSPIIVLCASHRQQSPLKLELLHSTCPSSV